MDVCKCIDIMRQEGFKDSRVERVMGFPKGSLARMYEKNHTNRTNWALLRVLASKPFLVLVAEAGYDPEYSKRIEAYWISQQLLKRMRYV